ncbi:MAG: OmpA family protein, partial [Acidobacteriota bacterium]|nr:OmpA family protein [Acidobacteriota bacterium]
SIEKRSPGYFIVGMKDPKAADPAAILRRDGLDAGEVEFVWYPFLSLNTPFAKEREREDAVRNIEKQLVRFDVGSSKVQLAEADKIAEIVETMRRWPEMKIHLSGRADDTGSAGTNEKLSMERAQNVKNALLEQGVNPARIDVTAFGNAQPLRQGASDWARADNRSVAAQVR